MALRRGRSTQLVNEETGARNVDVHVNHINDDAGPGELHSHAQAGSAGGHGVTREIEIYAPPGAGFHVVEAPHPG